MEGHDYPVTASEVEYTGFRFAVARDRVVMPDGQESDRVYMRHPGAVGAIALDDQGRVALIRQYRHPVRQRLWEIVAGLRDVEGEEPRLTAERELAEEVDLVADRMDHLLDFHPTPGCSDELIPLFLARGLRPVPVGARHVRDNEEAELELVWWPVPEAVAAIFDGRITNGLAVAGILAVSQKLATGEIGLDVVPPVTDDAEASLVSDAGSSLVSDAESSLVSDKGPP